MITSGNNSIKARNLIQNMMFNSDKNAKMTEVSGSNVMYHKNHQSIKDENTVGEVVCENTICDGNDIVKE